MARILSVHYDVPVSVHVLGAERVAVVYQRWVDHVLLLASVEQVVEEAQVAEAAADAVARAVLVDDVRLAGSQPA